MVSFIENIYFINILISFKVWLDFFCIRYVGQQNLVIRVFLVWFLCVVYCVKLFIVVLIRSKICLVYQCFCLKEFFFESCNLIFYCVCVQFMFGWCESYFEI